MSTAWKWGTAMFGALYGGYAFVRWFGSSEGTVEFSRETLTNVPFYLLLLSEALPGILVGSWLGFMAASAYQKRDGGELTPVEQFGLFGFIAMIAIGSFAGFIADNW